MKFKSPLFFGNPMPLKIAVVYLTAGYLWILFSDMILASLSNDTGVLSRMQTAKGWLFISITALLLFIFLTRHFRLVGRSEQLLRESEEKYRKLVETANDAIFIADAETGAILDANKQAGDLLGIPVEQIIGMHQSGLHPKEEAERYREIFKEHISSGKVISTDLFVCHKDGHRIPVEISASVFEVGNKRILQGIFRNITKRRKAEEALRESENKFQRLFQEFRALLDANPDTMILLSSELKVIWANHGAAAGLDVDISELAGRYCYELWHKRSVPCEHCAVQRSFRTGKMENDYNSSPDGRTWELRAVPIIDEKGAVTSVVEVARDITEHRRLEDQLRHSQKMDAVGQLAGGIAHDFNNLLTAIMGYGSLIRNEAGEDNLLRAYIDQILASSETAANLTQSLLAFSRKQLISLKPINLNEIIKRVEKLLGRIIGEDIEFKTILADADLTVMADFSQIEQVLMNLATNARDAMPDGGVLTIESHPVNVKGEFPREHTYMKPGMYALVLVADTGKGMDENTKERIFEPFFTTKEMGKGTGLGLAMVYGIIKQHGGYIDVYSERGKGTTFLIYLPVVGYYKEEMKPEMPAVAAGGTETVLIAEDDASVRRMIKTVLEGYGYSVIEAENGVGAMNKFIMNADRIKLLILDVIMSGKDGKDTYDEIKKIKPDIKAFFISGYPADIINKKGILDERLSFISKPFQPHQLLRKARETLDAAP